MSADYVQCLLFVVAAGTLAQSMHLRRTHGNGGQPLPVGGRSLKGLVLPNPVPPFLSNCQQINSRLGNHSGDTRHRVLKVYVGRPTNGAKASDAIIKRVDKLGTASNDTEDLRKWRLESICCVKFSKVLANNSSGQGSGRSTPPSSLNQSSDRKLLVAYATRYRNFTPEAPSRISQTTEATPNNATTVEPHPETPTSRKIHPKANHSIEEAINFTSEADPWIPAANISKTTKEHEFSWGRFDIDGTTPSSLGSATHRNSSELNFRLSTLAEESEREPVGARSSEEEWIDDVDATTMGLETETSTPVPDIVTVLNGTQTSLVGDNNATTVEVSAEVTMLTPRPGIEAENRGPDAALPDIGKTENKPPIESFLLPQINNDTYDDYNYYYDYDPIAVNTSPDVEAPPNPIPTETAPPVSSQSSHREDYNHTSTSAESSFEGAGLNLVSETAKPTEAVFVIPAQVSYGNKVTFDEDFAYGTEPTLGRGLTPESIKTSKKGYHSSEIPITQTSPKPTSHGRYPSRYDKTKLWSSIAPTITKSSNKPEITTASTNATINRVLAATTSPPSACAGKSAKLTDVLLSLPMQAVRTQGRLEREENKKLLFKTPSSSKIKFNDDGTLLVKYYYN